MKSPIRRALAVALVAGLAPLGAISGEHRKVKPADPITAEREREKVRQAKREEREAAARQPTGEKAAARRRRQIAAYTLRVQNGLARNEAIERSRA